MITTRWFLLQDHNDVSLLSKDMLITVNFQVILGHAWNVSLNDVQWRVPSFQDPFPVAWFHWRVSVQSQRTLGSSQGSSERGRRTSATCHPEGDPRLGHQLGPRDEGEWSVFLFQLVKLVSVHLFGAENKVIMIKRGVIPLHEFT